ncbi:MAG: response regulator [Deltaproteobacteria bacterium]|nr:response regulator [Deltaproteobacteria bacterium]
MTTANVELDADSLAKHGDIKPGPYVLLAISDTGVGMDEQTQQKIFEPFFTTKEQGKGTGLGLATVYGIVTQSEGYIWLYSEPGRGTTFKVYLPRIDAPATGKIKPDTAVSAARPATILIVEDEDAVRNLAERILKKSGYTVLTAARGSDALRLCAEHDGAIDLLITDVIMPQMSGREIADRLSALQPTLKVLYMSGYTDDAIVHHGVLDPGTNFVGKPFSSADLTIKVRNVLEMPREGVEPSRA